MGQPVVHFEIGCRNTAKTQEFYQGLFDWKFAPMGPTAAMIDTAAKTAGAPNINGHITALGHEPHNYVTIYVMVDDVQAALDKAQSLGGKILVKPVDIGQGIFAWFADPEGNTIGLWKPKMPAK